MNQKLLLARLKNARTGVVRMNEHLEDVIHLAHVNGMSLRDIAKEIDMSHESVRKVVNSTKT